MPASHVHAADATWTHFDTVSDSSARDSARLRDEFLSMPALCLTVSQVARLLAVTRVGASGLLKDLERERFLTRTANGSYRLAATA